MYVKYESIHWRALIRNCTNSKRLNSYNSYKFHPDFLHRKGKKGVVRDYIPVRGN